MRDILFRGQTRRKGEYIVNMAGDKCESHWVYGGIFPQNKDGDFAIIYQQEPEIRKFTVYADTVGQYTGLTDKNGEYSLRLAQTNKKGVVPGPYAVFLSWSDPNASENPIEGETEAAECPYNLPPRANSGELRFEVGDKGESAADFTFDSSEEPANVPVGI